MLIFSSEDVAIIRVRVYTRNRAIGSNFTYTETVPIAGYEDDDWTIPVNLNGLTTGRTVMQRIRGARSNVGIKEIKLHIKAVGDSSTWQFVVFEDNGSSVYNQVFTEDISVIVGDQTIPIVGSHVLDPGQLVGLKVPINGTVGLKNTVSNDPVIFENALVTTGTFSNSTTNSIMTLLVFGSEPTVAVTGDSIIAGSNGAEKFFTYFDSGSTIPDYVPGELDAAINQIIFQVNIKDSSITYQNLAQGGQTFDWVDTVAMNEVISVKPKILIIHAGTNDIDNGVIWSSVEASLDSISGKLPSGTQLFIDEILPRNDWNDTKAATSRTYNTNLQIWCNANDATLIVCHDALGKIRSSTGELDDLKDEFNLDDVHLTLDGVKLMAHLIHKSLLNFVKF